MKWHRRWGYFCDNLEIVSTRDHQSEELQVNNFRSGYAP